MADEDPMAYLNAMKAKMAHMEELQTVGDEALAAAANAKESMERIDAMLSEPAETKQSSSSSNKPPPGLKPDEEVEWWNRRIAALSGDVVPDAKHGNNSQSDYDGDKHQSQKAYKSYKK
mmetsp:Transcript_22560/g.32978  ORF Transcript_22560/g.32978 Transcript_22560/m.32978 type:complete len:119 (-) Transcript_22560:186-542(-)|eukprot:CAMPEP_0185026954 /NCGR_PEP_ID=MMETSP1103-20130426/11652_1 /TAXON_ID=36769 /ORGANISM="Paraphysomonas bandaiensis, Strain Caron Lab Isolate" /LENGTH=118 /DNA_ID=CAMNT_0027560733 /DNA_START=9 /DNA_END=365 /DNA_ORIENTATION=+